VHPQVVSLTPTRPITDPTELWHSLLDTTAGEQPDPPRSGSVMEAGVSLLSELNRAPPRTLHSSSLVKSSPLSSSVRSMLEEKEFGRRFDAIPLDVASIEDRLPPLQCPEHDVQFLASDRSLDDLNLSVGGLLQHRKRLVASTINPNLPRRHVFVLGAGPAGLIAAIQLSLRDHRVVVCEQRELYSRNRYIGVYKEVTHLMAALGMPESMTYDFSQYRGKRGIMLADIQTLLHGVALKLGVVIYTGAVPRRLDLQTLKTGEVELQRATRAARHSPASIGLTRWQHDSISRVSSGAVIRFDTIVEATGGRSELRETLVGQENVVSIYDIGKAAAIDDPSLDSYFDDPFDHTAEYVESDYGCPSGLRPKFASVLINGNRAEIPDAIPCFVSNIEASVLTKRMHPTDRSLGLASRIGETDLNIPHDWVVVECRLADQSLSRYHVEGPLPQCFDFGGKQVPTHEVLDKLNPVSLLVRILYAMGVPFDAIDRRKLIDFYTAESSRADVSDIVSTWIGRFRGLRVGASKKPIWCGNLPGSDQIEYGIIGESLQNAWYRFGVGVDDAFNGASFFAAGLDLMPEQRLAEALRFERVMRSRSVHILYHLYAVAQNKDQGVVGSVLTEYHMEEQQTEYIAEARLRDVATEGAEMLAVETDLRNSGKDFLLEAALDYLREGCCRRALDLLGSLPYSPAILATIRKPFDSDQAEWRAEVLETFEDRLSETHQGLLSPLFQQSEGDNGAADQRLWLERLTELASGRYEWATPWLRACALRALYTSASTALSTLKAAVSDPDPLVAEVAAATLEAYQRNGDNQTCITRAPSTTIDKVLLLKNVRIFEAIPYEELAGIASLLERRVFQHGEQIFEKGDVGDCLYVFESGRVHVHDGDRTFRYMGPDGFFGELALLDSKPRSATVTAVEPTSLFRLNQDDFYALLSEQPQISRSINRALCKIIRDLSA
jgi:Cyclic nucleotide-binding domain